MVRGEAPFLRPASPSRNACAGWRVDGGGRARRSGARGAPHLTSSLTTSGRRTSRGYFDELRFERKHVLGTAASSGSGCTVRSQVQSCLPALGPTRHGERGRPGAPTESPEGREGPPGADLRATRRRAGESRVLDGAHQRVCSGGEVAGARGSGLEERRRCSRIAPAVEERRTTATARRASPQRGQVTRGGAVALESLEGGAPEWQGASGDE
jgi:hypothetical protein